jgi:hypothetical protein
MSTCTFCGGTRVIKTSDGIKCRDNQCEGSKTAMQPALQCDQCEEPMQYMGLNSWGEPNYKCPSCGVISKL